MSITERVRSATVRVRGGLRVAAILGAVAAICTPATASAQDGAGEDFNRRDRTALLYRTKFLFTRENVPVLNVLVAEGESRVAFGSEGPLDFLPEGDGGPRVRVGRGRTECTATMDGGGKASIRYWTALARVPARDMDAVRKARDEWEGRGLKVRMFERGSVFGFYGRVLDNRSLVLVEDRPFDEPAAARTRRHELAGSTAEGTLEVFEEVVRRPEGTVKVACTGVDAAMEFPGLVAVAATPDRLLRVEAVEYGKGFSWHAREDRTYRGQLILTPDRDGKLAVVNSVDAESLLKGLVPSEIFTDAPVEALRAQAVVARGELFAKLGNRHTADPYMICADVHCQMYRGAGRENPRTSRAVDDTRGEMPFHGDELVDSVYSSSCGGHTEDGGAVWQGASRPYLKGVPDREGPRDEFRGDRSEDAVRKFIQHPPPGAFCASQRWGKDTFRWSRTLAPAEIRKGVQAMTGRDPGDVTGLKVLQRGVSGRILRLQVDGSIAPVELSPELTIRKALGGLRSSMFVVDRDGRGYRFQGGGFGHGVGMCQTGAVGMAEKGRDYKGILRHYFTGSDVGKVY